MASVRHELERRVVSPLGQGTRKREIGLVLLAAEDERAGDDQSAVELEPRGFPRHLESSTRSAAAQSPRARVNWCGFGSSDTSCRCRKPCGRKRLIAARPRTRRRIPVGRRSNPAQITSVSSSAATRIATRAPRDKPAESHRSVRRRDPAHFLDGGVGTTAVGSDEMGARTSRSPESAPDLRLPGARAGSDAVKKNQRRHWINLGSA